MLEITTVLGGYVQRSLQQISIKDRKQSRVGYFNKTVVCAIFVEHEVLWFQIRMDEAFLMNVLLGMKKNLIDLFKKF